MDNLIVRALKNNGLRRAASLASSSASITDYAFGLFGGLNKQGVNVNLNQALSLSAVYNAVDQISNDIAKLPKGVYQKTQGQRFRRQDHPVDYLISKRPNALMTQFSFHKSIMVHALLRGNGLGVIERDRYTGIQKAIHLVMPEDAYTIKKMGGNLYYTIEGYGTLSSEDIIHIPGFSFNGVTGISVFRYAAQNLSAALSADVFADDNFRSKGLLAGIIKSEKGIKPDAKSALSNAMEARLSKGGTHNIGFLDEGMDFLSISASAQEASLIDWKKTSTEDVARWFNIAPHKIKQLENATYSNIEQQSLEHGSDTIMPWAKRIEEEYDYKMFTEPERAEHYVRFNTNALIRTDVKTKGEYYYRAAGGPWHTRNEVRALEDLNPLDGFDDPLTPTNAWTQEQIDNSLNNEE